MFAREKRIGPYSYIYLVENVREEGRPKQRIIANLGRKEVVSARGDLDRLTRSLARLAQRSLVLSVLDGEAPSGIACRDRAANDLTADPLPRTWAVRIIGRWRSCLAMSLRWIERRLRQGTKCQPRCRMSLIRGRAENLYSD